MTALNPYPTDSLWRECAAFLTRFDDSPRTQRTYTTALRRFHAFKCEQKSTPARPAPAVHLSDLDVGDLDAFNASLANLSPFTRRTYAAAVKAMLTYLLARGRVSTAFSVERAKALLDQNRKRSPYPVPQPDDTLPRILHYLDTQPLPAGDKPIQQAARLRLLRDRALFHLMYASAARLSEVLSLDRKHVQAGQRKEATIRGKGNRERIIFFTDKALVHVRVYCHEREDLFAPLFISHGRDPGKRLNPRSVRRLLQRHARAVGIQAHPHDFRHFRARQMLDRGAPLEAIQEILGHSDISTTRRVYAHYSKPTIRAIFDKTADTPE